MHRKEKEISDARILDSLLEQAVVLRLGMCDQGRPYIVPLNFVYDAPGKRIFLHCAPQGMKIDMLRANPNVCFEVDEDAEVLTPEDPAKACGHGMRYRSVIGFGTARFIEDPAEKEAGLRLLTNKHVAGEYSFSAKAVAATTVIEISIESMTGKQSGFSE